MSLNRRSLLKQLCAGAAASSFLQTATVEAAPRGGEPENSPAGQGRVTHLDRNENAYGPSRKAIAAFQESAGQANLYPETLALQSALATHHNMKAEQILLGCGSSDVLRMAAASFLSPTATLVSAKPTCELISRFARQRGAHVQEVALRKDYAHDLSVMLEGTKGAGAHGVVYICNPNSPTGSLTPRKDLDEFLSKVPSNFHVVMDEAYHEYAGTSGAYVSFVDRASENSRVIVTRSFSSGYGLAGTRVGYGVAGAAVISKMAAESLPYAVNRAGTAAALAALGDQQHLDNTVKKIFNDRQEFMNQVNARMLRALDSHANFVCLNVMRPAAEIAEHYRKHNVIVAPVIPELPTYLRISLGSPGEMREFWHVWDLLGAHPMAM